MMRRFLFITKIAVESSSWSTPYGKRFNPIEIKKSIPLPFTF